MYTNTSPARLIDISPDDIAARVRYTTATARRWCWLRDIPAADHADAVQEAHLVVAYAMTRYDDTRPLRPYLFTCIVRRLCSWRQKLRRRVRQVDVRHVQSQRPPVRVTLDLDEIVNRLTLTEIAVTMLSDFEQQLLELLLDGVEVEDISYGYGVTHQCIYDKIRRLVRKLRDILADEEDQDK
jgi:RNA polymerase sigma factor (sigma-70 family)